MNENKMLLEQFRSLNLADQSVLLNKLQQEYELQQPVIEAAKQEILKCRRA